MPNHIASRLPFSSKTDGITRLAELTPVVVIVSVDVPEPFVIDAGLNAQLAPLGNPVHDRATEPLNPATGVTVTVEVAEPPGLTLAGDSADAAIVKSGTAAPVPDKLTIEAVELALFVTFRLALAAPVALGANVTLIVQLPPGCTVPQLLVWLNSDAFVPPMLTPVTCRAAFPRLVSVTGTALD